MLYRKGCSILPYFVFFLICFEKILNCPLLISWITTKWVKSFSKLFYWFCPTLTTFVISVFKKTSTDAKNLVSWDMNLKSKSVKLHYHVWFSYHIIFNYSILTVKFFLIKNFVHHDFYKVTSQTCKKYRSLQKIFN